jgi:pimeloyl-ACP methyl ester carboxylesterase
MPSPNFQTIMLAFMQVLVDRTTNHVSDAIAFVRGLLTGWEFWLLLMAIVGCLFSFWSIWHVKKHEFNPQRLGIGIALILLVVCFGISVVKAPPTSGEIEEETRDKPITVAATLKEKLDESIYAYDYPGWAIAKELAQCSSDVYLSPVEAEEALKKRGYKSVASLNSSTLVGYVASLGDTSVIMFRGTNPSEIQDWFINLSNRSRMVDHGNVHAGFWTGYDSLHGQLAKVLEASKPKKVWITGHSLGGALAVVCAYRLSSMENLEIAGVMTFGQPKVGNPAFCKHMEVTLSGRMVHFVNESDLVPRVPPSFDHFGSLVWYKGGGIRRSQPPMLAMRSGPEGGGEALSEDEFVEIPEMTEEEFEQSKLDMQLPGNVQFKPDGEPLMQRRFSLVDDHDIAIYIDRLK